MKKNNNPRPKFKIDEIFLVLVVAMIAVFYSTYNNDKSHIMEAEKITELILDHHKISFAYNGIVDENKLNEIRRMNYEEFKGYIEAKNDFCVYLEDGNGKLIAAKGSSKLGKDVEYCKE